MKDRRLYQHDTLSRSDQCGDGASSWSSWVWPRETQTPLPQHSSSIFSVLDLALLVRLLHGRTVTVHAPLVDARRTDRAGTISPESLSALGVHGCGQIDLGLGGGITVRSCPSRH